MSRPIWSGSITFGLVTIPVQLFTATQEHGIHFHMVTPDGKCRLRRKLVCPETGKEYDFQNTARSVEIAPDQYVVVDPQELKKFKPEKGDVLELRQFVKLEEIDPIIFRSPYYVGPGKHGDKPYRLLLEALRETGRVGIGQFVMRDKEYLCCVRPAGKALCLETLLYADELREAPAPVEGTKTSAVSPKDLKLAQQLIESLTEKFKYESFKDHTRDELKKFIEREAKQHGTKEAPAGARRPRTDRATVVDLTARLEQSLKRKRAASPRKKGGKAANADR
jgi:DNA end-binding protein Ku